MVLEGEEGNLEKVAMGNHEREKAGINKVSACAYFFGFIQALIILLFKIKYK
jgi:hypothetical protein